MSLRSAVLALLVLGADFATALSAFPVLAGIGKFQEMRVGHAGRGSCIIWHQVFFRILGMAAARASHAFLQSFQSAVAMLAETADPIHLDGAFADDFLRHVTLQCNGIAPKTFISKFTGL